MTKKKGFHAGIHRTVLGLSGTQTSSHDYTWNWKTMIKKMLSWCAFTDITCPPSPCSSSFHRRREDAHPRLFKVPEDRHDKIYKALNEQNNAFRFVTLLSMKTHNTVQMENGCGLPGKTMSAISAGNWVAWAA